MHLLRPPSSFLRLPLPHNSSGEQQSLYSCARAKTKKRAPSLYAATASCVCGALPYTRQPPLVSSSPFPMFNDSPLCPGPSSLYAANSPLCPGTSSPYGETAICVRGLFHTCGHSPSCLGARSLSAATSPRVRELGPCGSTACPAAPSPRSPIPFQRQQRFFFQFGFPVLFPSLLSYLFLHVCSRPFHHECFRLFFLPRWLLDLFSAVSFLEVWSYSSCCYWCCFAGCDHCGGEGTPQFLKHQLPINCLSGCY